MQKRQDWVQPLAESGTSSIRVSLCTIRETKHMSDLHERQYFLLSDCLILSSCLYSQMGWPFRQSVVVISSGGYYKRMCKRLKEKGHFEEYFAVFSQNEHLIRWKFPLSSALPLFEDAHYHFANITDLHTIWFYFCISERCISYDDKPRTSDFHAERTSISACRCHPFIFQRIFQICVRAPESLFKFHPAPGFAPYSSLWCTQG